MEFQWRSRQATYVVGEDLGGSVSLDTNVLGLLLLEGDLGSLELLLGGNLVGSGAFLSKVNFEVSKSSGADVCT